MGSRECFPVLNQFFELSFGLLDGTGMKPKGGSVRSDALTFLQEMVILYVGDGGCGFG